MAPAPVLAPEELEDGAYSAPGARSQAVTDGDTVLAFNPSGQAGGAEDKSGSEEGASSVSG